MFRLRVKEVLQEKGVSQGALSRGANIPINAVHRLVKDLNYIPSAYTLLKAARYLGVPMEALCFEDDQPVQQATS